MNPVIISMKTLKTLLVFLIMTFNVIASNTYEKNADNLKLYISYEQINDRILKLSNELNEIYKDKEVLVVLVLKGSIIFASDLIKELKGNFILETIKASSYGMKGSKRTKLQLYGLENLEIENKHVLLIDDIFDSGNTLYNIKQAFLEKKPSSVRTAVLLKKNIKRDISYLPDYSLFDIDDKFVVGYGLDYKECFRNLKGIYIVDEK